MTDKAYIAYKKGYKYQLKHHYRVELPELAGYPGAITEYILLQPGHHSSQLTLRVGYAWDGPSGPTIDTKDFMRGSLVHDALYQLMREGYMTGRSARKVADKILKRMCLEDGMFFLRAELVYIAVRLFARFAADPASKKPVEHAP